MATKAKPKTKAVKKPAGRASVASKSIRLKAKTGKAVTANVSRNGSKRTNNKESARRHSKLTAVESRRTPVADNLPSRSTIDRTRSRNFTGAVTVYETGIRLMHGEEFEKAIRSFQSVITEFPEEPEIQERAKVLLLACEKKIQERGRTVLRSADDHYNVGIAQLNRRELDSAISHLQHAMKLMPKADHILYALATANALQGNREQALEYLKQSIHYRGENRFLAARDDDFESLQEDPDFKQLVASAEK